MFKHSSKAIFWISSSISLWLQRGFLLRNFLNYFTQHFFSEWFHTTLFKNFVLRWSFQEFLETHLNTRGRIPIRFVREFTVTGKCEKIHYQHCYVPVVWWTMFQSPRTCWRNPLRNKMCSQHYILYTLSHINNFKSVWIVSDFVTVLWDFNQLKKLETSQPSWVSNEFNALYEEGEGQRQWEVFNTDQMFDCNVYKVIQ